MVILALDTTTASGSAALVRDGELVASHIGDAARTHGERLPGDLTALLDTQSLTLADIDAFAVCSGPGSFTGLRVGLATIQAMALVNRRPVVPVPTLEALAWAAVWTPGAADRPDLVGAWMNAHRGEVFAALYRNPSRDDERGAGDWWQPLQAVSAPSVGRPEIVGREWHDRRPQGTGSVTVIGDAVEATRALLITELDDTVRLVGFVPPLASVAGRIADGVVRKQGGVRPHAVRPVYVRRPDAELARERTGRATNTRIHTPSV